MEIQPITADDVPIVERLAYDYNKELDPKGPRKEAVLQWIASVFEATWIGKRFFWLARFEEDVAGFVSFQICPNPFTKEAYGFIEDLYIAPPFRRRGYAEKLMQAVLRELSQRGARHIQLDVLAHNEQGLVFWKKQGFTLHHYVFIQSFSAENTQKE